jgi:hypothetical protein
VVVEGEVLVDLAVLGIAAKSSGQDFDVFKGNPMLVELFVHSVHVSDDAISLSKTMITWVLSCRFYCLMALASSIILT